MLHQMIFFIKTGNFRPIVYGAMKIMWMIVFICLVQFTIVNRTTVIGHMFIFHQVNNWRTEGIILFTESYAISVIQLDSTVGVQVFDMALSLLVYFIGSPFYLYRLHALHSG